MSFTGKVIIVTGASSGIGADAAKHLASLGGQLALVAKNENCLNEVAEEIRKSGSLELPLVIVADVTKDGERIINDTVKHFGKLDVLVNNAGIYQSDSVNEFNVTHFDRVLDTNLRSVAILTSLAVPYLEKTKGNVVNISSISGIKSAHTTLSYSVSKAALDQFTKCAALDLAPKRIRVNSINPGIIRTPIFGKFGLSAADAEELLKNFQTKHPIGRLGEVSDTSAAIAYIASDSASFITGIIFPVDGGYIIAN